MKDKSQVNACPAGRRAGVCTDCKKPFDIPFDNGDGRIRCAACAVDKYMKMPSAKLDMIIQSVIKYWQPNEKL